MEIPESVVCSAVDPGPATLSQLDSARFGVVAARANGVTPDTIPAVLSFCEQHDVEFLIARCDGQDLAATRALLGAGLALVETQLTFEGPCQDDRPDGELRQATASDRDGIASLTADAFSELVGHYHADPRLSLDSARDAYVDWAVRGLDGDAADVIYVAEVDGNVAAYMTFKIEGDRLEAPLAAVGRAGRGRGLYGALARSGMSWGLEHGINRLAIVTSHGNIPVQRNLIKLGMAPVQSTATFHGWFDLK